MGDGYGFPSSHSQWMGYFAAFLACHLYTRHRFASFGHPAIDTLFRLAVYAGIWAWALCVAYSRYRSSCTPHRLVANGRRRYYLRYHSPPQVLAGLALGTAFGALYYALVEALPRAYPSSPAGRLRRWLVGNPVSTFVRLRDGWSVWPDGGYEAEWLLWRREWEAQTAKKVQ
jgi:dolichyldiphosphatase